MQFDNFTNGDNIGYYHGLNYQDWDARSGSTGNGLAPVSQPIFAEASAADDETDQDETTLNTYGAIKMGSKPFALISFYYGCGYPNALTGVVEPVGCALELNGKNIEMNHVGSVALNYAPRKTSVGQMSLAQVPAYYTDLFYVSLGVATPSALEQPVNIYIDNVTHVDCA